LIDLEEILGLSTEQILKELTSLAPCDGSKLIIAIKSLAIVIIKHSALCMEVRSLQYVCTSIQKPARIYACELDWYLPSKPAILYTGFSR